MHVYFRDNIDSLHNRRIILLGDTFVDNALFVCSFQKSIATDLFLHWRQLQRPLQKLG